MTLGRAYAYSLTVIFLAGSLIAPLYLLFRFIEPWYLAVIPAVLWVAIWAGRGAVLLVGSLIFLDVNDMGQS